MIKGIVFDFGGVMTTVIMPERVRPIVDELGIEWKVLEDGFAKYRSLMDGDEMTAEEMYAKIWSEAGITITPEIQARILKEDFSSFLYRNEATLEWMRELKASGYKIGILTNMPRCFAPRFREAFADFIALADAMVISGEVRLHKPMREIYDLLRDRIGLKGEEICFVDDSEVNCRGAEAAGWTAVRFTSVAECRGKIPPLKGSEE